MYRDLIDALQASSWKSAYLMIAAGALAISPIRCEEAEVESPLSKVKNSQDTSELLVERTKEVPQASVELRADPSAKIEEKFYQYPYPHKKLTVSDVKEITNLQRQWIPTYDGTFPTMIAHPRETSFSLAWRSRDTAFNDKVVAVSLGDTFPIYRWEGWGQQKTGMMQVAIEGGIWATFNYPNNDPDLLNTDYLVGIPFNYSDGRWNFRSRLYHISAHLGDEYIQTHEGVTRLNPSFEALDFYTMCDVNQNMWIYGGLGFVLRSDKTFKLKRLYADLGVEFRAKPTFYHHRNLVMQPFLATNAHFAQTHRFRPEINTDLGLEWSQIPGTGRKLRSFFEYFHGYSQEGQFANKRTNFFALKVSYGY